MNLEKCYKKLIRSYLDVLLPIPVTFIQRISGKNKVTSYISRCNQSKSSTSRRRLFLHKLSGQLSKPQIEFGANDSRIYKAFSTRNAIVAIYGGPMGVLDNAAGSEAERHSTGRLEQKGNCCIYPKCRRTRKACTLCNKLV